MRKIIAYIFLLIFSFQVVPVKELGKILFKGQITEEEVHNWGGTSEEPIPSKHKKDGDPFYYNANFQETARSKFLSHQLNLALHCAERIPRWHVPDIVTPPPNC